MAIILPCDGGEVKTQDAAERLSPRVGAGATLVA
jgi:hypothetical protein